jgi:glyoxylase-like metal-dependent hydrolase (beta-lactamase superfamily II)
MRRWIARGLATLLLLAAAVGAWAWWRVGYVEVERVTESVYVLRGVGGNVGVLVTSAGVVVVDTMTFPRQGSAILARLREITTQPVVMILNTHYHRDHTHGNPAFAPGTKVVATAQTRAHLERRDADFWKDERARGMLPNETFEHTHEFRIADKTVRSHHVGRAHTDGDLVVHFVEDRVLHVGDLFFNGHYPNIDLEAGGSVREWPATMERVLALDLEFDQVIPGHGPLSNRAGYRAFQGFIASLWEQTSAVAAAGGTRADALREVDLAGFGLTPLWFARSLNRDFVIGRAYEEATAARR